MGVNKITHLISLQHFIQKHINDFGYYDLKGHYEAFLSKDVKKGMFIPCDEDDNVLEEPIISEYLLDRPNGTPIKSKNTPDAYKFRKGKERVLFEGWTYDFEEEYLVFEIGEKEWYILGFEDIEGCTLKDLIFEELKLSQTALNEIYNVKYETN